MASNVTGPAVLPTPAKEESKGFQKAQKGTKGLFEEILQSLRIDKTVPEEIETLKSSRPLPSRSKKGMPTPPDRSGVDKLLKEVVTSDLDPAEPSSRPQNPKTSKEAPPLGKKTESSLPETILSKTPLSGSTKRNLQEPLPSSDEKPRGVKERSFFAEKEAKKSDVSLPKEPWLLEESERETEPLSAKKSEADTSFTPDRKNGPTLEIFSRFSRMFSEDTAPKKEDVPFHATPKTPPSPFGSERAETEEKAPLPEKEPLRHHTLDTSSYLLQDSSPNSQGRETADLQNENFPLSTLLKILEKKEPKNTPSQKAGPDPLLPEKSSPDPSPRLTSSPHLTTEASDDSLVPLAERAFRIKTLQRWEDRFETLRQSHRLRKTKGIEALKTEAQKHGIASLKIEVEEKGEKKPLESGKSGPEKGENGHSFSTKPPLGLSLTTAELLEKSKRTSVKLSPPTPEKRREPLQELVTTSDRLKSERVVSEGESRKRTIPSVTSKTEKLENLFQTLFTSAKKTASLHTPAEEKRESAGPVGSSVSPLEASSEPIREGEGELFHAVEPESGETDALNRKIIDAKATVRHFARRLRNEIENYKPPFTRIKMSMEPKELGSVEVTLVSRGSNLHVQVHSNPTAIGVMATQGQELKSQLVSMGFSEVQMQFGTNQQHQQRPSRQPLPKHAFSEEEIPDFYESIDLIIPQYV